MIQKKRHFCITCVLLAIVCLRTTCSESATNKRAGHLQSTESKLRSFFRSLNDLTQASQFFKKDRSPQAASSPPADHFNERNKGFHSAVIPRKKPMPSYIQPRSHRTTSESDDDGTILRSFEALKDKILLGPAMKSEYRRLGRSEIWSPRSTRTSSPPHSLPSDAHQQNSRWSSQSFTGNTILDDIGDTRDTHENRRPKLRNYGQKSSQYCPKLSVSTRTIFRCSKGRKLGSKCHLSCADGFELAGKRKSRRCRGYQGKRRKHQGNLVPYWSGRQEDFQCVPACKDIGTPENGERTCKLVDHAGGKVRRCKTRCKAGYRVVGKTQNTCNENGRWSGQPAVCKVASATRRTSKIRFKYREYQKLPCGEVYSLASFRKNGTVHLVAGDKNHEEVKIFQWGNGKFNATAYQTFHYPGVKVVGAVTAPDGTTWLVIDGGGPVTMYRMDEDGRFHRSHTTELFGVKSMVGMKSTVGDTISFAELGGEFYRCYGRNRRETPVIVVQKIHSGRDVFQRIMRKKLPGEKVHQCSMYTEDDSLYTVATLNRASGEGRILIGYLTRRRMKVVDVISGKHLRHVTDSFGFTVDGDRYMAVSQGVENGECLIYKRHWRRRPPGETG